MLNKLLQRLRTFGRSGTERGQPDPEPTSPRRSETQPESAPPLSQESDLLLREVHARTRPIAVSQLAIQPRRSLTVSQARLPLYYRPPQTRRDIGQAVLPLVNSRPGPTEPQAPEVDQPDEGTFYEGSTGDEAWDALWKLRGTSRPPSDQPHSAPQTPISPSAPPSPGRPGGPRIGPAHTPPPPPGAVQRTPQGADTPRPTREPAAPPQPVSMPDESGEDEAVPPRSIRHAVTGVDRPDASSPSITPRPPTPASTRLDAPPVTETPPAQTPPRRPSGPTPSTEPDRPLTPRGERKAAPASHPQEQRSPGRAKETPSAAPVQGETEPVPPPASGEQQSRLPVEGTPHSDREPSAQAQRPQPTEAPASSPPPAIQRETQEPDTPQRASFPAIPLPPEPQAEAAPEHAPRPTEPPGTAAPRPSARQRGTHPMGSETVQQAPEPQPPDAVMPDVQESTPPSGMGLLGRLRRLLTPREPKPERQDPDRPVPTTPATGYRDPQVGDRAQPEQGRLTPPAPLQRAESSQAATQPPGAPPDRPSPSPVPSVLDLGQEVAERHRPRALPVAPPATPLVQPRRTAQTQKEDGTQPSNVAQPSAVPPTPSRREPPLGPKASDTEPATPLVRPRVSTVERVIDSREALRQALQPRIVPAVQRAPEAAAAATAPSPPANTAPRRDQEPDQQQQKDIDSLARDVYRILRRRLLVERERERGR